MEAEWQADRSALRDLLHTRPDLSLKEIARRLKRSYSWAKDWAKRLAAAPPDNLEVLISRSRARHTQPPDWDPLVLQRIEQMRLFPPEGLQRTPGPKALLSYLPRDAELQQRGCRLPRSTTTIWQLLKRLGLLADTPLPTHKEEPLCEPLEEVQTDWRKMLWIPPADRPDALDPLLDALTNRQLDAWMAHLIKVPRLAYPKQAVLPRPYRWKEVQAMTDLMHPTSTPVLFQTILQRTAGGTRRVGLALLLL